MNRQRKKRKKMGLGGKAWKRRKSSQLTVWSIATSAECNLLRVPLKTIYLRIRWKIIPSKFNRMIKDRSKEDNSRGKLSKSKIKGIKLEQL